MEIDRIIRTLTIPSSTIPSDGLPPLLSRGGEEFERDVAAWRRPDPDALPVYIDRVYRVDPNNVGQLADLFSNIIAPGVLVVIDGPIRNEVVSLFVSLKELMLGDNVPWFDRATMALLLDHPISGLSGNLATVKRLVRSRSLNRIQDYLDARNVSTFDAQSIINLSSPDLFFYLTRFYGPPQLGDLETATEIREYMAKASNNETRFLTDRIRDTEQGYRNIGRETFTAYFDALNSDPDDARIWQSLGTTKDRLLNDPVFYLGLTKRPRDLPPLTLSMLRDFRSDDPDLIHDVLLYYTDDEIEQLVGSFDAEEVINRNELVREAIRRLRRTSFRIMTPEEAVACNNAETLLSLDPFSQLDEFFIAKGSLMTGYDCFTVEDLLLSWQSNTNEDGEVSYVSPINPRELWSSEQLRQLTEVLLLGRPSLETPPWLIDVMFGHVAKATEQEADIKRKVRGVVEWARRSPENTETIRRLWTTMFEMGMYMRQWRGPGTAYPVLAGETGEELRPGEERETVLAASVTEKKNEFDTVMASIPPELSRAIWSLPQVRFFGREVEFGNARTIDVLYRVTLVDATECIRMASGIFSFTGAYYLKQTLDEEIPGYRIDTPIEYIQ